MAMNYNYDWLGYTCSPWVVGGWKCTADIHIVAGKMTTVNIPQKPTKHNLLVTGCQRLRSMYIYMCIYIYTHTSYIYIYICTSYISIYTSHTHTYIYIYNYIYVSACYYKYTLAHVSTWLDAKRSHGATSRLRLRRRASAVPCWRIWCLRWIHPRPAGPRSPTARMGLFRWKSDVVLSMLNIF